MTITAIAAQPLNDTVSATPLAFAFTVGGTVPSPDTALITVASGSMAFSLDPSTVPAWLTATASGTASTSGATVTFTPVSSVVKGLAPGSYSGSIGYEAQYAQSERTIAVVLTISNPTATVSIKGTATNPTILNYAATAGGISNAGATQPSPSFTILSSDEPTGFTAVCTVTSNYPAYVQVTSPACSLAGASTAGSTVTGIAYTFGTTLTATLDSALFATGTPFGTVVTVTLHVTAGSQSTVSQSYAYTLQPTAPTLTAVFPTSVAQIATGDSLVITLTGTNFVSPDLILSGSSIVPTQVFVGATNVTTDAVVLNLTTMQVSVPQADFPAFASGHTTANMVLGAANELTVVPTAATATETVVVTTAPVVYALTSTASYVQPAPGSNQSVTQYELVSIFGANFGPSSNLTGTLTAFNQFNDTVTISGAGTTASPYVTLGVTFKQSGTTYKAPILFANATQINCIVPSGLATGSNATVTVTDGTNVSDGLFTVGVVVSQPGIFTLASDGVGQGAILNSDYSVNGPTNAASAGSSIQIYMTGLGAPLLGAADTTAITSQVYPTSCVAISDLTANQPGYLQVVNAARSGYTPPSPAWTNIDGAVIEPSDLIGAGALPPCFPNASPTAMVVNFGTTPGTITYAGFVSGSVAGLYQVNVTVPNGLTTGNVPITFSIGSNTSPAGVVTVAVH